jgi:hypothetical protein
MTCPADGIPSVRALLYPDTDDTTRRRTTMQGTKEETRVEVSAPTPKCGHTAHGGNGPFTCDLSEGHRGWHAQRVTLRRSNGPGTYTETTNWGDDGLAIHASRDEARRRYSS